VLGYHLPRADLKALCQRMGVTPHAGACAVVLGAAAHEPGAGAGGRPRGQRGQAEPRCRPATEPSGPQAGPPDPGPHPAQLPPPGPRGRVVANIKALAPHARAAAPPPRKRTKSKSKTTVRFRGRGLYQSTVFGPKVQVQTNGQAPKSISPSPSPIRLGRRSPEVQPKVRLGAAKPKGGFCTQ
jgi:hypothetical protein